MNLDGTFDEYTNSAFQNNRKTKKKKLEKNEKPVSLQNSSKQIILTAN